MKLNKNAITSFITAMCLALAFIVLASFILWAPLQSLERLLFGSWSMLERFQTCQVDSKPVDCASKAMTPRSALESSETLMSQVESLKTTFCHYHTKNHRKSSTVCLAQL